MRRILMFMMTCRWGPTTLPGKDHVMKNALLALTIALALSIPNPAEAQFGVLKSRPVMWDIVVNPGESVSKTITVWGAAEGDFCLASHNGITEAWPVQVTCNVYKASSARVTIKNLSVGDGSAMVLVGRVRVMVLH